MGQGARGHLTGWLRDLLSTRSRSRWTVSIVFLALLVVGAAPFFYSGHLEARLVRSDPNAVPADPDLMSFAVDHGATIFSSRCAGCHGANGRGDPQRGVPDLADADWLYASGQ